MFNKFLKRKKKKKRRNSPSRARGSPQAAEGAPADAAPKEGANPENNNAAAPVAAASEHKKRRLKIAMPAGVQLGFDPFQQGQDADFLPVADSFGQPILPMEPDGIHIMNPNKRRADSNPAPPPAPEKIKNIDVGAEGVTEKDFYHGLLPREDITNMLKKDGDFLMRKTEVKGERQMCLSAKVKDKVEHFVLVAKGGQFFLTDDKPFPTVADLINHYYQNKVAFGACGAVLQRPVCRQDWEIRTNKIQLVGTLAQWEFGHIMAAKLTMPDNSVQEANVKVVRGQLTKDKIEEVMKEARLMRMMNHPNVHKCFGVAADDDPLMIVLEAVNGSFLDQFLRARQNSVTIDDRVQMVYDAALGLHHIHCYGVIHRDIAARSFLYSKTKTLKISEFSMAAHTAALQLKADDKLPVRAMPPELFLTQLYTPACDVWALGVAVWEIFNNAQEPYTGWPPGKIKEELVKNHYNLTLPAYAPQYLKDLVKDMFKYDPCERARAIDVCKVIENVRRGSETTKVGDPRKHSTGASSKPGAEDLTVAAGVSPLPVGASPRNKNRRRVRTAVEKEAGGEDGKPQRRVRALKKNAQL